MKSKILFTMLLAMTCAISFAQTEERQAFDIKNVEAVTVESSWANFTDNAIIELPAKWAFQKKGISIRDYIKKGDAVSISLGYGNERKQVFAGYVSEVGSSVPISIKCEDNMYQLKRKSVSLSKASISLKQLLAEIVPSQYSIDAVDAQLGAFKASNTTVAKVLEKLKEKYGLVSYFRGNTLYVGKVHIGTESSPKAIFVFEENIQENGLKYRDDDYKLKVRAISNLLNGKKLEVELGDAGGDERTLNYFNIQDKASLKAFAQADFEKLKMGGYEGDIVVYGAPNLNHGDIVALSSSDYPERNGNYFIDGVSTEFRQGFSQKLKIGKRVS